jgi:hypothetical protein
LHCFEALTGQDGTSTKKSEELLKRDEPNELLKFNQVEAPIQRKNFPQTARIMPWCTSRIATSHAWRQTAASFSTGGAG